MNDVKLYRSKWQKKEGEKFRVRFSVSELEENRVTTVLQDEDKDGEKHWVEFLMWDYETMIRLRRLSMKYSNELRSFHVDADLFNENKIKHLMLSWSFGEVDPHMKLHHKDGVLTDESLQLFKNLHSCVALKIIEKMNDVFEGYE